MATTEFRLADYLQPRGRYPYAQLAPDLEAALAAGETVYLWSVPGFFMLSGHPNMTEHGIPWSDGRDNYATAADCLAGRNPVEMIDLDALAAAAE